MLLINICEYIDYFVNMILIYDIFDKLRKYLIGNFSFCLFR